MYEPLACAGPDVARQLLQILRSMDHLPAEDKSWLLELASGHVSLAQFKYKAAQTSFSTMAAAFPTEVAPQLQLARVHAAQDQHAEAVVLFGKVHSRDPACVDYMDEYASCLCACFALCRL